MASNEHKPTPTKPAGNSASSGRKNRAVPEGRARQTARENRASQSVSAGRESPAVVYGNPSQRIRYRWFTAFLMVIATVIGCLFLSIFILESAQDLFGLNQKDRVVELTIPKGSTNGDIAQILADKSIISQTLTFMLYSSLKSDEGDFKPGDYLFNENMSYDEIIYALTNKSEGKEVVTLTFREGRTVQEIARLLEENDVCGADKFLDYLQTASFDYEFIDRMPDDSTRFRRLEGYIFPDTYDFYIGESPQNVAAKFLNNFQRKITGELEDRMMKLNLTLDEAITLASIIQKEAGTLEEMKMVSSVFHNRLRESELYPKLQSDVTINYVNNFIKRYINFSNQDLYDSYNTYECDGLPVGPICNPGLDAIVAALNPAESDYFFFVTDINGEYYYAATANEHYKNINTAKAQTDEDGNKGEVHGIDVQGE